MIFSVPEMRVGRTTKKKKNHFFEWVLWSALNQENITDIVKAIRVSGPVFYFFILQLVNGRVVITHRAPSERAFEKKKTVAGVARFTVSKIFFWTLC